MQAQFLPPQSNFHGNLLWQKSELIGRSEHLTASISALNLMGYWASPFPEGDGIVFSCSDKTRFDAEILADFKSAFPWLDILSEEIDGERAVMCTVIVPILKVKIEDSFSFGKFQFVCARYFDQDPELRLGDYESEFIQFDTTLKYGDLLRLGRATKFNDIVIKQCLAQAEHAMDIIRFQFSSFLRPSFTPNPAGQMGDGFYSVSLIPHDTSLSKMKLEGIALPMGASNKWLGPEVECANAKGKFLLVEILNGRSDELSNRIKVALRSCRQSFYGTGDESRFLNLIFALDGLIGPQKDWMGWKHRTYVAAAISGGDPKRFEVVLERYDFLYTELRNALVHGGSDFYQLASNPDEACQDVYDYIRYVIEMVEVEGVEKVSDIHDLAKTWLQSGSFAASSSKIISAVCLARGKPISLPSWA